MNRPPNGQIPIIGQSIKKIIPIEPFHIDGLGWFKPDSTITSEHVSHLLIILITLISPKPPNVVFELKKYGEEHDLLRYFTDEKPATLKQIDMDNARITEEFKKLQ